MMASRDIDYSIYGVATKIVSQRGYFIYYFPVPHFYPIYPQAGGLIFFIWSIGLIPVIAAIVTGAGMHIEYT